MDILLARSRSAAAVAAFAACLLLAPTAHCAAGAQRGSDVFDEQCAECHSVKAGKQRKGPSLFGVMGRVAGTQPDYVYSPAMKESGITWTPASLARYLAAPREVVAGGKMKFNGHLSDQDLADLTSFLEGLH